MDIPEKLNADSFHKLLSSISSASVCVGNANFPDLINKKNTLASYEEFKNRKEEIIATLENDQFSQVMQLLEGMLILVSLYLLMKDVIIAQSI